MPIQQIILICPITEPLNLNLRLDIIPNEINHEPEITCNVSCKLWNCSQPLFMLTTTNIIRCIWYGVQQMRKHKMTATEIQNERKNKLLIYNIFFYLNFGILNWFNHLIYAILLCIRTTVFLFRFSAAAPTAAVRL